MKNMTWIAVLLMASLAYAYPQKEALQQWNVLNADIANRPHFEKYDAQAFHASATILKEDKDPLDVLLRRTQALIADLSEKGTSQPEERLAALAKIEKACSKVAPDTPERQDLFNQLLDLRRAVSFSNPLVASIDKLLFITRDLRVMEHMADQYYGSQQKPGGGLFILKDPFGDNPQRVSVLEDVKVEQGRFAGKELLFATDETAPKGSPIGSILSPSLDFDGQRIAFSYVPCRGHRNVLLYPEHTGEGHWDLDFCYHIFTVNLDGTDLRQITDGQYNDIYPCWTPAGRLAFLSERRGGFLRCGRSCPNYTLYDMKADGSNIRCLSYHEVNEWSPTIAHDGRIVWTRWDYVDRHGCVAHVPWYTMTDGRDPRPLRGNYSFRYQRPDVDIDTRAIPFSKKYVSTAAPHHGQSFGSLTIIDPNQKDDDSMGPTRRLTPEVGFPESQQGGRQVYGNAWPLSEEYYLASYCPSYVLGVKHHHYGLYLVDKFGNKELIYRDPTLAALTPIPARPTKRPPVLQEQRDDTKDTATVSILNVYKSLLPWPKDVKRIHALRVWQIYPMSISSDQVSRNVGIQIPEGFDSTNLARSVVGTVPVHEDGSVQFIAPAGIELFFQALDEHGAAVQSMRSATAFIPGETRSCIGCHEPKDGLSVNVSDAHSVAAFKEPPAILKPGPEGSRPFSYPRLVQPVLDAKCVSCHDDTIAEGKASKLPPKLGKEVVRLKTSGHMNKSTDYYQSYISLAQPYGFYSYGAGRNFNHPNFYRTIPGHFGARASKLYPMLKKGHHGVKLTSEEMERIIIWLDSVCQFYGVYETEGMNEQLKGGIAHPTLE